MPNLVGVAAPSTAPLFVGVTPFADVNCPAGAQTTFLTFSNVVASSPGVYYPLVTVMLSVGMGATVPNPLIITCQTNGGSNWSTQPNANFSILAANGNYFFNWPIPGPPSEVVFRSPGATITVSLTASGQPVTVRASGTFGSLMLIRATDQ